MIASGRVLPGKGNLRRTWSPARASNATSESCTGDQSRGPAVARIHLPRRPRRSSRSSPRRTNPQRWCECWRRGPNKPRAALSLAEVPRALRRNSVRRPPMMRRAERALGQLSLIRVDRDILEIAGEFRRPDLRTLDAVHLASALSLGADLEGVVNLRSAAVGGGPGSGRQRCWRPREVQRRARPGHDRARSSVITRPHVHVHDADLSRRERDLARAHGGGAPLGAAAGDHAGRAHAGARAAHRGARSPPATSCTSRPDWYVSDQRRRPSPCSQVTAALARRGAAHRLRGGQSPLHLRPGRRAPAAAGRYGDGAPARTPRRPVRARAVDLRAARGRQRQDHDHLRCCSPSCSSATGSFRRAASPTRSGSRPTRRRGACATAPGWSVRDGAPRGRGGPGRRRRRRRGHAAGGGRRPRAWCALTRGSTRMKTVPEFRAASRQMGRQTAASPRRSATTRCSPASCVRSTTARARPPRPPVFGAAAGRFGAGAEPVAAAYLYSTAALLVGAGLRLLTLASSTASACWRPCGRSSRGSPRRRRARRRGHVDVHSCALSSPAVRHARLEHEVCSGHERFPRPLKVASGPSRLRQDGAHRGRSCLRPARRARHGRDHQRHLHEKTPSSRAPRALGRERVVGVETGGCRTRRSGRMRR